MKSVIIAVAAVIGIFAVPAVATATPGLYTKNGNLTITLAVSGGCATISWPKGGTRVICEEVYQTTQHNVEPGDTFGAEISSSTGGGVACSVVDDTSGDVVGQDSGLPGETADCMWNAA